MINEIWKYLHTQYIWDINRPESIPNLFLNHLSIVGWSMFFSLLIALPLALLITRFERLYLPVISVAGLLYTIPSLVILAILVPIPGFGLNQSSVIITLVVYAQILLLRNFVAGIRAVDPSLIEVGRAMGMSEQQLLWRVTLPLALPIIFAGIRVATVTTIGIATIAMFVSVPDLGTLIFRGLHPVYPPEIIVGAALITILAVFADLILLGIQRLLDRGRTYTTAS